MSISTKTGDHGQTSLLNGERVWKDDLRVDAYGTLDELDAQISEAAHTIGDPSVLNVIKKLQNDLYRIMGELASTDPDYSIPICIEKQ